MKKIFLLLTMAAFFVGCSSDDDNNNGGSTQAIVGTWVITEFKVNDNDLPLTECEQLEKIIFAQDNKFDEQHYDNATSSGDCLNYDDDFIGSWSETNGNYDIQANPDDSFAFFNDASSIAASFSGDGSQMEMVLQMPADSGSSAFEITLKFNRVP